MIYQVLKVMADKGMLGDMFNNVAGVADAPYLCEKGCFRAEGCPWQYGSYG